MILKIARTKGLVSLFLLLILLCFGSYSKGQSDVWVKGVMRNVFHENTASFVSGTMEKSAYEVTQC